MECSHCDELLRHYEALTFALFKARSELAIAKQMCESDAVRRFAAEMLDLTKQRSAASAALIEHQNAAHGVLNQWNYAS